MLVLTRKTDEKIIINGNIEIVVVEVGKNSVRLGIKAPNDVQVYREEVFLEIQQENTLSKDANVDKLEGIEFKNKSGKKTFILPLKPKK